MKTELLKILNPFRRMKVEAAKRIAAMVHPAMNEEIVACEILQSYEAFEEMPLTKGMFVPPDNPSASIDPKAFYHVDYTIMQDGTRINQPARIQGADMTEPQIIQHFQRQVIFKGFEKSTAQDNRVFNKDGTVRVDFQREVYLTTTERTYRCVGSTIGDLRTEIERYNKTAATPIELELNENVLTLLKLNV